MWSQPYPESIWNQLYPQIHLEPTLPPNHMTEEEAIEVLRQAYQTIAKGK